MSDQYQLPPKQSVETMLKVLGFLLLVFIGVMIVLGQPGGVELLIMLIIVLAMHFALRIVIWLVRVVGTAIAAFFQATSRIRIRFPKRPPTKREIAQWLSGDLKVKDAMLDEAPLDEDERRAGKRQNKRNYIQKMNDLFGNKP